MSVGSVSFGDIYNPPPANADGLSSRPHPLPSTSDPLDWECPNKLCRNINFKKRPRCNICGAPKPENAKQDPRYERARAEAIRLGLPDSANVEWACRSCGAVNLLDEGQCHGCQQPRPDVQELEGFSPAWAGATNPMMQAQQLANRRSWDSDDEEVDEFGRKKKAAPDHTRDRRKAALARLYAKRSSAGGGSGGGCGGVTNIAETHQSNGRSRSRSRG